MKSTLVLISFDINLGTGVMPRGNKLLGKHNEIFFAALFLGTLTLGICLDLDCFQYCCINDMHWKM